MKNTPETSRILDTLNIAAYEDLERKQRSGLYAIINSIEGSYRLEPEDIGEHLESIKPNLPEWYLAKLEGKPKPLAKAV